MHGFPEIDGVQRLDDIAALFEHFAAFHQHCTLRVIPVKIENRSVAYNFRGLEIICFHIITHQPLHLVL